MEDVPTNPTFSSSENSPKSSVQPLFAGPLEVTQIMIADHREVGKSLIRFDLFGEDLCLDVSFAHINATLQQPSIMFDPAASAEWKILEATSHYLRFERDGRHSNLETAEEIFRILESSPRLDLLTEMRVLYGLGRVFEAWYDHGLDYNLLERSCEYYRRAMDAATKLRGVACFLWSEIAAHLGRAIVILNFRGECDLLESTEILWGVIQRTDEIDPSRVYALAHLSHAYYLSWHVGVRDGMSDLVKSEELIREALQHSPNHRHRSRFLQRLAAILISGGSVESIRVSISVAEQSVTLFRTNPPIHAVDMSTLAAMGRAYGMLFELEGRLADLDHSIALGMVSERNITAGPAGNLCMQLSMRFNQTGRMVDIDLAIERGCRQMERILTGHNLDYARNHLGQAYVFRFAQGGDVEDFEKAASLLHTGIENCTTPALLPGLLSFLALLYRLHGDLSNQLSDLDLAVVGSKQVVAACIEDWDLPGYKSASAEYLLKRFQHGNVPSDLSDSISTHEEALKMVSDGHSDRPSMLHRYGQALRIRFEVYHVYQDSDKCMEVLQEALDLAVPGKLSSRSICLSEMAALLSARYTHLFVERDLTLSLFYYQRASEIPDASSNARFLSAVTGARLAQEYWRITQSAELFSTAVSLLPRIAWIGHNAHRQYAKLVENSTQLACDAAACVIRAGELDRAVELLDEGRSIVWRSVLELRTDLEGLKEVAPLLATELMAVAETLEYDDVGASVPTAPQAEEGAARRHRAAERWEELVDEVRTLQGFQSFLKPLDFSILRQATTAGPAVFLNVSEYGSDALIVSIHHPVRAIPLPGLSMSTVRRLSYVFARALRIPRDQLGRRILESVLLDISRQLWNAGIKAVADALLDYPSEPDDRPLHVWWIPTGFLSLLPVHCAGPYKVGQPGIPDIFISSYTTTLSALLRARQRRESCMQVSFSSLRVLGIGIPETPGLPHLPSTRAEMELLAKNSAFEGSCAFLYGPAATVQAVTTALPEYNWIHASCHGHHDPVQPLNNAFNLRDGPLTLANIIQLRLNRADFAYLSACHTARHTTFVPDESLHLVAGLQIAGFRGVVGTAWSMVDGDGPQLAQRFYHWLTVNGRAPTQAMQQRL